MLDYAAKLDKICGNFTGSNKNYTFVVEYAILLLTHQLKPMPQWYITAVKLK